MIIKYLPLVAFLMFTQFATGQTAFVDKTIQTSFAATANDNNSTETFNQKPDYFSLKPLMPFSGGGSGSDKNFCLAINLGASNIMGTISNYTAKVTPELAYQVAAGLSIAKDGQADGHKSVISIMASITGIASVLKYTDKINKEVTLRYTLTSFGLPVSYTGIITNNADIGFFYQGGLDIEYNSKDYDDRRLATKEFNTIFVSPFASLGFTFPTKGGEYNGIHFKPEQVMIGPFVSYLANNMSSLNNSSLNCLTFGIRMYVMQIND